MLRQGVAGVVQQPELLLEMLLVRVEFGFEPCLLDAQLAEFALSAQRGDKITEGEPG